MCNRKEFFSSRLDLSEGRKKRKNQNQNFIIIIIIIIIILVAAGIAEMG